MTAIERPPFLGQFFQTAPNACRSDVRSANSSDCKGSKASQAVFLSLYSTRHSPWPACYPLSGDWILFGPLQPIETSSIC